MGDRDQVCLRILPNGNLEITDPDPSLLHLLNAVNPSYAVETKALPGFCRPRVHTCRGVDTGLARDELAHLTTQTLWARHDESLVMMKVPSRWPEVSVLDLKIELAKRALRACNLCAWRCGVNRLKGEQGKCGLGPAGYVGDHFVHVAEEPPINPAYVLNLQGCGLRCRFCQQFRLLPIRPHRGIPLTPSVWADIEQNGTRSLEFVGGNPDESLYAVLTFLHGAPRDFALPVVWNTHGYCTEVTLKLLDGVIDVFLPDCKYGNDACAERWSGIPHYWRTFQGMLPRMLAQQVPVIVRILVLPGHAPCCHLPSIRWLASLRHRAELRVSVLGQYAPTFLIRPDEGPMARRTTKDEVDQVRDEVGRLGLELV